MPLDRPGRREALQVLHESGGLAGRGDLARYAVAAVHGSRERVPAAAAADPTVAAFLVGDYAAAVPLFLRDAESAEARGQLALAVYARAGAARCQIALGELVEGVATLEQTRALLARLPGVTTAGSSCTTRAQKMPWSWPWTRAGSSGSASSAPWMARHPTEHWGSAAIDAIGARAQARKGHVGQAMALLARPVRALRLAPAWAPNYCRMACEVAETLWLLDRRDHLAVVESALRDKALPADFRFPMTDARLALGRLCALVGRTDEAARWFAEARDVLDAQRARPLRAVVDHDEALMWLRSGDAAAASAAGRRSRRGVPGAGDARLVPAARPSVEAHLAHLRPVHAGRQLLVDDPRHARHHRRQPAEEPPRVLRVDVRLARGLVLVVGEHDVLVVAFDALVGREVQVAGLFAHLGGVAADAFEEVGALVRPDVDADDDEDHAVFVPGVGPG
jgi:ATP/maltotriose-dependent transcriptional regulator MalT